MPDLMCAVCLDMEKRGYWVPDDSVKGVWKKYLTQVQGTLYCGVHIPQVPHSNYGNTEHIDGVEGEFDGEEDCRRWP